MADDVVGAVETPAFEPLGKADDGPVMLCAGYASPFAFAMNEAPLEIEAEKAAAKMDAVNRKVKAYSAKKEASATGVEPEEMYTLKFNSPILPFAKFPLT